jgi:hypothetical protein
MAIGRISGPLLKANLLREGVNLAFENDLLYLDVNNSRIGINTDTPQYDLDVNGTTRAPQLEIATQADIADITIVGNQIYTNTGRLTLGTADNVIYQNKLVIDDFDIENNVISTNSANTNINISPNGTGSVEIFADTNVYGNITATGTVTAEGNITLGDADTDSVTFNAEIASNIIPDADNTYALGSDPAGGGKQWADVWTQNFYAGTVTTTALEVDGVDLALRQGNIFYVAENGDDSYSGDHPNDPYGSLTYALTQASAGDTIHIYPGVYEETFPMTVPAGVTVKGHSIRSVKIVPTVATQSNDAFMLNGESTVEDITVADFYYDSINDDGYAFKLAPGCTVTSRSPYVRNVSVITQGSVTSSGDPRGFDQGDAGKGALIDGSAVDASSREAGCLFHSVTFITPGVDALTITNGARVEWLNCFTYFANRGLYALDGASGLKGTGQTAIRVDGASGPFVAGETFEYYDTDGVTLLASGTIDSVDADGKFYITGNLTGLEVAAERGGKTVTSYNNASLETDQAKFGTSSLLLDGVDDYIGLAANNDFGFGTDDFTVEGYIYKTTSGGTLFDFRAGASNDNAVTLGILGTGEPYVYVNGSYRITSASPISNNQWIHLAYVRNGSTGTLYVNGTSVGTWSDSTDYGVAKPLIIGAVYTGTAGFISGYVDEIRISKGVARYTANFGVPLAEFTSDTNTVLLLHFNGDDSSNVIVDDALNSQDLRFSGGATADYVTLADKTDFGGEVRSIASACVYGNYGAYGDGNGVLMYLISQNFAYIGNGKAVDNDPNTVVQANEVVELNNAKIRYSSVDHQGDFRVGEFFYVNQQDGTVDFTSSEFNIDTTSGLTITTGASTTTITGDRIDTGNLRISGNTLSSLSGDIDLDADSGVIRINSTGALQLPTGDTVSRPTPALGMIRYNTDNNLFEGYDGNWIALNGVYDLDLDTYITAELTPGANDDTLRFYVGGSLVVDIDENRLNTPKIVVDDITIDGNVIETTTTDTDLVLSANGTGSVVIDELAFKDSSITNTTPDGILYFQQSGSGYFKIEGTGGFVVPVGNNVQRPAAAYRETGMTRYNTEQRYLEIWDGFSWVSVAGATGSISFAAAEDLSIEYVLTLG